MRTSIYREPEYFHDFEIKPPFRYVYNTTNLLYNDYDVCRNCFHSRGYVDSFGISQCPGPNPPRVEIPESAAYITQKDFDTLIKLLTEMADLDVRATENIVAMEEKIARLEARVLLLETENLFASVLENTDLRDQLAKEARKNADALKSQSQSQTSWGFLATAEHMAPETAPTEFPTDHLPEGSH